MRAWFAAAFLLAATPVVAQEELPFSPAVRAGDLLFLSGAIGRAPGSKALVPGGIIPETEQTLMNLETTLKAHGGIMRDVVKCTVFLADMAEWPAMNSVYVRFFKTPSRHARRSAPTASR